MQLSLEALGHWKQRKIRAVKQAEESLKSVCGHLVCPLVTYISKDILSPRTLTPPNRVTS